MLRNINPFGLIPLDIEELHPLDPARRLIAYVMIASLRCLLNPLRIDKGHPEGPRITDGLDYVEAYGWIMSEAEGHPFDYLTVCQILSLDASSGRAVARELHAERQQLKEQYERVELHDRVRVGSKSSGSKVASILIHTNTSGRWSTASPLRKLLTGAR
jgi:hypothetical protein